MGKWGQKAPLETGRVWELKLEKNMNIFWNPLWCEDFFEKRSIFPQQLWQLLRGLQP